MEIKNYNLEELIIGKDFFEDKKNNMYYFFIILFILFFILMFIFFYIKEIDVKVKGVGVIQKEKNISIIKSEISGEVIINNLKTGNIVKKNEILLKLDDEKIEKKYNYLLNKLNENKLLNDFLNGNKGISNNLIKNYILYENNLSSKLNEEKLNVLNIRKNLELNKKLYDIGEISKINLDNAINNYEIAVSKKNTLESEIKNLKANKKEEISKLIKEIELELLELEKNKNKNIIKSPIDGVVEVVNNINVGEIIDNRILANIVPIENLYEVKVYILEKDIHKLNVNNKVNYVLRNYENNEIYLKGNIKYISVIPQNINDKIYYYIICDIENKDVDLRNVNNLETSIVYGRKTILNYILDVIKNY